MFEFRNWKKFREKIINDGFDIVKFDFTYHTCDMRIIYALAQNVFIIAIRGTQNGFMISLNGYKTSHTVDNNLYRELARCKNMPFDPDRPYNPFDFLIELNKFIGSSQIQFVVPTKSDYQGTATNAIPDEQKIFFQRWIPHTTDGKNVTKENIAKIEKLLGYNISKFCEKNNVSIGFTNVPTDRSIDVLKDFESDYENNV